MSVSISLLGQMSGLAHLLGGCAVDNVAVLLNKF